MKVAVVGATGLVGSQMIKVLEEHSFPVTELIPVASEKSVGKKVTFKGKEYSVVGMETAIEMKPQLAVFSAGGATSRQWAPKALKESSALPAIRKLDIRPCRYAQHSYPRRPLPGRGSR